MLINMAVGFASMAWAINASAAPAARPAEVPPPAASARPPAQVAQAATAPGTPGSASGTTTIDGRYLPPPPPRFGGLIGLDAKTSRPWWPPRVVPPKGAPNILLIMTDDQGYGVSGTFGGVIPTPALDRIASAGLRYTRFHSTSLCSPTRAALLTGRNHHSVGFGVVANLSTGYPGYDSIIGPEGATIGAVLRDNGYATSWFGKNHNTPSFQAGAAGPFDQWPNGMGFEYFYGFMGGYTDQWTPYLFRNTTQVFPWTEKPGYNLTTDMADEAISHIRRLDATAPDTPFFVYYVPGGSHAPHQPTKEWVDKYKGRFDIGWNALRDQIFANQKRLGVVPPNTQLTPWPDSLPRWEALSAEEKKLYARQAEVFAAYVAYTDHEIGRVIQAVADMGKFDDTLIIYICGDNGTSAEGTVRGTFNQQTAFNGIVDLPIDVNMRAYDQWGAATTYPSMSAAWAWSFDSPFKWTKEVASHFGGTRQGMAISWPVRIKDAGGIRTQFHHVIDIVPTLLEAAGIPEPVMVDGVAQKAIEGTSMLYTFDQANADAPSTRTQQYFEMEANRGIYLDGWYACTTPPAAPWLMGTGELPGDVVNGYSWELYDLANDYSQADDLAAKMPDKLRQMQEAFMVEAARYDVFPLDNSFLPRHLAKRPDTSAGRTVFTYAGELAGLSQGDAPSVLNRSFSIIAEVEVPEGGAEGMLVTNGGRFGGFGLYMLEGRPVFTYNMLDLERFRWEGSAALAPGRHTISFDFTYDGPGFGKGGTGVLKVDGQQIANRKIPRTIPFVITVDETFDVGIDLRTPIDDGDYQVPFRFTGTVVSLTVTLGAEQVQQAADGPSPTEQP